MPPNVTRLATWRSVPAAVTEKAPATVADRNSGNVEGLVEREPIVVPLVRTAALDRVGGVVSAARVTTTL